MVSCPGYFETQPDSSTFIRSILDHMIEYMDIYKDHKISGAVMFTKKRKVPRNMPKLFEQEITWSAEGKSSKED